MPTEYNIVIADTTCFILLDSIGEMDLLEKLFKEVSTTAVIAAEFGKPLPQWVHINEVKDVQFQVSLDIDPGEASAIALAVESSPSLLVLDDNKARKAARRLNLTVTGTLGLFLKAKRSGIIDNIKPIFVKIQQTNFRYTEAILQEILSLAGE